MKAPINQEAPSVSMSASTMILLNLLHQDKHKENRYSLEQIKSQGKLLQWQIRHYNKFTKLNDFVPESEIQKLPESF